MPVRTLFPDGIFGPPANEQEIKHVETKLGVVLPDELRCLYLEADGFREPKGNAKYLLSLTGEDVIGSLISTTLFWWREWPTVTKPNYPIDFTPYIFFGFSSADKVWGIDCREPTRFIAYHHNMEGDVERFVGDIEALFVSDYRLYEG